MLHLYPSNNIEHLASILAKLHVTPPLSDPFKDEIVLTQSHGMGVWLKQQLSASERVACFLQMKMPGAFLWQLIEALVPGSSDEMGVHKFEKDTLRWEIYSRLPELLPQNIFKPLRDYLDALQERDGGDDRSKHLFRLSELLADNFDAYQNYRADWISAWERDNQPSELSSLSDADWQAVLWRSIYPGQEITSRVHRASQVTRLAKILKSGAFDQTLLPERLFVFGMAAIPSGWLPVFVELSKHIDIHFLFQNPCRVYWSDDLSEAQSLRLKKRSAEQSESGAREAIRKTEWSSSSHPLLSSQGLLGKHYLAQIYAYDETSGVQEFQSDLFSETPSGSLLAHLQNDILNGGITHKQDSQPDESIRFALCHSRLREVEALRDYILDAIASDDSLEPRDFIVMAPDIQAYKPYVDAVFSNAVPDVNGHAQRLRYALSDHALNSEQPFLQSLSLVLGLAEERVSIDQVFALLELPPVMQKFGFREHDLSWAKKLCQSLNIRWGMSDEHRARLSGAKSKNAKTTWRYALQRALRSYLIGAVSNLEEGYLEVPLRTSEQHEVVGKLLYILELMEECSAGLLGGKAMGDWVQKVSSIWNAWFEFDAIPESILSLMDQTLETLIEQAQLADFKEEIPFSLVRDAIDGSLQAQKVSQRFLSGRINFCNLMPMRTVPFKVVCLLGMNEGEYPRQDLPQSYDLIRQAPPRQGDRSRRVDDRYMFLEALLSAKERLYISYQGFNIKDNSAAFPSVLVAELQDVCRRSFAGLSASSADSSGLDSSDLDSSDLGSSDLKSITTVHRLQSFHPSYYEEQSSATDSVRTFMHDWIPLLTERSNANEVQATVVQQVEEVDKDIIHELANRKDRAIELKEWESAFASPMKHYYLRCLGLNLPQGISKSEQSEPFDLDALERFFIARDLVGVWLSEEEHEAGEIDGVSSISASEASLEKVFEIQGLLPEEPVARYCLDEVREAYGSLSAFAPNPSDLVLKPLNLALSDPLSGLEISGNCLVSNTGLVDGHISRRPHRWFFGAWARHVVWNARYAQQTENVPLQSVCFTPDWRVVFPALTPEQSAEYLSQLCRYYAHISRQPCAFFPQQYFNLLSGKDKSVSGAFKRMPLTEEDALLWMRISELGISRGKELEIDPWQDALFVQIAQHCEKLSEVTDPEQCIQFEELRR